MAVLGLIATGLALKNFRDAKAEYDAAVKAFNIEKTALILSINEYNATKYDQLAEYNQRLLDPETGLPYNENDVVSGLAITPILNIFEYGIIGIHIMYYQRICIGITNTTDKTITIRKVGGVMYSYGMIVGHIGNTKQTRGYIIEPHKTYTLNVNFGDSYDNYVQAQQAKDRGENTVIANNTFDGKPYAEKVLEALYSANYAKGVKSGKRNVLVPGTIIQSSASGKGVCKDALYADIEISYNDDLNKTVRRALYKNMHGYICYAG